MPVLPFGLAYDPCFLRHDTGLIHTALPDGTILEPIDHPSSTTITARIHALLLGSGFAAHCTPIKARAATPDELADFHDRGYVEHVATMCAAGGGELGDYTPVGPGSYEAAVWAAGSGINAVDAVLDGRVRAAYLLARPPGHHAEPARGMGYCLFNNVAIAARHAQRRGLERILILDWDVHHGNGTQAGFYEDPSVLFISLHQDDWYPAGLGTLEEEGKGPGLGATINVPLPCGTGDRGYLEVLETVVVPAARRFAPDLIFVSAGQDAAMMDPLGRMMVSMEGFRAMGLLVRELADDLSQGKWLLFQEGGYSLPYTPFCTLGVLEGASGHLTGTPDPFGLGSEVAKARSIYTEETRAAIKAARQAHHRHILG